MELRLLVEARHDQSTSLSITLEGRQWRLTPPLDTTDQSSIPKFICISYLWGQGRSPNSFDRERLMSDQTLPALAAVTRNSSASAFWIDAFCIPAKQPQRSATLESMGFIYNLAFAVFVALSGPAFAILNRMNRSDQVSGEQLLTLEQDEWVSSVWTYQEIINSKMLHFVSSQPGVAVIDGSMFLNRLGYSLTLLGKEMGISTFDICRRFPRLDALQEVLADFRMANYCEVSALQALSNLDRRFTGKPKNYFYSLLGVVSKTPIWRGESSTMAELSERFMSSCEQKNDYSFIYSSSPRDECAGRRWRPQPGVIHAVLAWHYGQQGAQKGHQTTEGFWLDAMMQFGSPEHLSKTAKENIIKSLFLSSEPASSDAAIAEEVFQRLQQIGFTGSNTYLTSNEGIFFPQSPLENEARTTVMVATCVNWVFGAPGIARMTRLDEPDIFTAGVFVGTWNKDRIFPVLLDSTAAQSTATPG